jgi:predicted nuclease of restriction endonuclease-like (RecB) superfamily
MLSDYTSFLATIKQRIQQAQYDALKAVNKELLGLYRDIGAMIVEKEKSHQWWENFIGNLAKDIQKSYSGIKWFSERNVRYMKEFYLTYNGNQKLQPLVAEISWTKNVLIMTHCEDDLQREFYLKMTQKFGWTKNVLTHQIENQTYEKYLTNQTNFDITMAEEYKDQAKLAVKDEYTFDFLELWAEHAEREIEKAIIWQVKGFLTEFGGFFSFIGSQYRIEVWNKEFFVDLLLYHRKLRCMVAIELKIGDFEPEYVSKMNFYLSVLDEKVKMPEENPSIGIILCKNKDRAIVEYTLKDTNKPIWVAKYEIYKSLPSDFAWLLPSEDEIEKLLASL